MVNNVLSSICYAGGTLLLCHFEPSRNLVRDTNNVPHTLGQTEKSPKPFVSPTSTKCARNPFVSPTYAKTGGGLSQP